jgi:rusticyanin
MQGKPKKNNFLVYEVIAVALIVVIAIAVIYTLVPSSPSAALLKFIKTVPSGVAVYSTNNSIIITGSNVTLPIVAYENLSYNPVYNITYPVNVTAADSFLETPNHELPYFMDYGLIDPTFVIKKGSTVNFIFINLGAEIHIFAITPQAPPFNPFITLSPETLKADLLYLPALPPPANFNNPFSGSIYSTSGSYTFNATGTYYYLCPIPGHAELGMYGKIEVV